jgi:hypothetical protein
MIKKVKKKKKVLNSKFYKENKLVHQRDAAQKIK